MNTDGFTASDAVDDASRQRDRVADRLLAEIRKAERLVAEADKRNRDKRTGPPTHHQKLKAGLPKNVVKEYEGPSDRVVYPQHTYTTVSDTSQYSSSAASVPITGLTDRLERMEDQLECMEDQLAQVLVVLEDIVTKVDWMVEAFQEDE